MSDERTRTGGPDILQELEAEVAETLAEEALPPGGPALLRIRKTGKAGSLKDVRIIDSSPATS